MAKTNRLIGIGALLSFATIIAADAQRKTDPGFPTSREWIGVSIAFFFMAAASDLGFDAAGGMAMLVTVAIIIARGDAAFRYLGNLTAKKPTKRNTATRVHPAAPVKGTRVT